MELAIELEKEKGIGDCYEQEFSFSPEERQEAILLVLIALEQEIMSEDPVI